MHKATLSRKMTLAVEVPDADDLNLINASGPLRPLTADDVIVRSCLAINTQRMESGIQMPDEEVRAIAGKSVGAPIQRNHDTFTGDGLPVGRIFSANANQNGDTMECRQRFYLMRDAEGLSLAQRIDGGVIQEVSCSFTYDRMECSIDGGDMWDCNHVPNEEYNGKQCTAIVRGVDEYLETSLVWKGAARGTKIGLVAMFSASFGEEWAREFARRKQPMPITFGSMFKGREPKFADLFR